MTFLLENRNSTSREREDEDEDVSQASCFSIACREVCPSGPVGYWLALDIKLDLARGQCVGGISNISGHGLPD